MLYSNKPPEKPAIGRQYYDNSTAVIFKYSSNKLPEYLKQTTLDARLSRAR